MSLPERGTGLSTGRAGERQYGSPRSDEERLARHYGNHSQGTFSGTERVVVVLAGAVAGALIALGLEWIFKRT